MSSNAADWFTRARYIFYGTATALVEILQDPQKRTENLNRLSMDLKQLAEELAQKGELTEQEAIRYLESLRGAPPSPAPEAGTPVPTLSSTEVAANPAPPSPATGAGSSTAISKEEMAELMELIHQIESLRLELERLRTDPPASTSSPDK